MATYHIEVTAEDIAAGVRGSCGRCPVALACLRAIGSRFTSASYDHCALDMGYTLVPWPDGALVERFMVTFDAGRPVKPFAFDLEVPDVAAA